MEKNGMKNIVVLKNLPSNIVEEAIVILKTNKYAKKIEYIDKVNSQSGEKQKNKKDYIIREAESVLANYIDKMENKDRQKRKINDDKKYKKLKIYSIVISILLLITILI